MDKELHADSRRDPSTPREGNIPAGDSELYYREVGEGRPIIVLHGSTAELLSPKHKREILEMEIS